MIEPESDARGVLEFLVETRESDGFFLATDISFWMGWPIDRVESAMAVLKAERLVRVSPATMRTYRFASGHKRTCEIPESYLANNDGRLVLREIRKESPFYV